MTFQSILVLYLMTMVSCSSTVVDMSKISSSLRSKVDASESVNISIKIKEAADAREKIYEQAAEKHGQDRGERIRFTQEKLEKMAQENNQPVLNLLKQTSEFPHGKIATFWISNTIIVDQASPALVLELTKLDTVERVDEELVAELF